jgi:hypothetical protein
MLIHYGWLHSGKLFAPIKLDLRSPEQEFGEHCFPKGRSMHTQIILCTVGFSLALGAAEARATQAAPARAIVQSASHSSDASHDLGVLLPPPDSDNPSPASASASTASSAEPIPELPTWAMMLVLFLGLGLAGLKKGRKDRLSPGIE